MDAELDIYGTPAPVLNPNQYQRLVHLDLKGAPPKMNYLLKILPMFKEWGATGLLVEYEDTFPYSGELGMLPKAAEAYSLSEVMSLQQAAEELGLEYIPLVQSFGHLEFALKHPAFSHLREDPQDARSLCPSNPGSLKLVQCLIDQIMEHHPNTKYLHIGADEVWMKSRCQKCHETIMQTFQGQPVCLFLSHVKSVLMYIREKYPNVRPIMWDDMLREVDFEAIQESTLGDLVDIMVWNYLDTKTSFHLTTPEKTWQRFGKVFKNVWIASAFKGAFGPTLFLTPELEHIRNQELWVADLQETVPKQLNFKGIAFTGWQRYTHETVLCELMPVGLPSLAFCLHTFIQGCFSEDTHRSVSQQLGFPDLLDLEIQTNRTLAEIPVGVPKATYPGSELYTCARQLATLQSSQEGQRFFQILSNRRAFQKESEEMETSEKAPLPALSDDEVESVTSLLSRMMMLKSSAENELNRVYNPPTTKEWLKLCVMPLIKHLEQILAQTKEMSK